MRFQKKPVVVEAAYFDGELVGMTDRTGKRVVPNTCPDWFPAVVPERDDAAELAAGDVAWMGGALCIGTLEGNHRAAPGDWIICGIKGELYPCKPDIFEATYTRVG